jgi:subtilisin family serine protease
VSGKACSHLHDFETVNLQNVLNLGDAMEEYRTILFLMPEPKLFGLSQTKLEPKLRVIANGKADVNVQRAGQCGSLAVRAGTPAVRQARTLPSSPELVQAFAETGKAPRVTHQKELDSSVKASVFVFHREEAVATQTKAHAVPGQTVRMGNLSIAQVPVNKLPELVEIDDVTHVELGQALVHPRPVIHHGNVSTPSVGSRKFGTAAKHKDGAGVLVGIIDVQGFDFAHPDFLDANGKTRFVSIWDQQGGARPAPAPSGERFGYGSEILAAHMNRAIEREAQLRTAGGMVVPAWELEPQSQQELGSHGTHVASIAAGNLGVCRKAPISAVLISVPENETDRRLSFYDSTRIADAVDYLLKEGARLGLPVSINVSLGTNGHAHDGSAAVNRWIDSQLSWPGRAVVVAAGNAGQEAPVQPGDSGFVMGRIHTRGRIAAAGLENDIDWIVVGNTIMDLSENEFEIWHSPQDRIEVSVRPPGSNTWIGPIKPGEFIENRQLPDKTFLSIYNEIYHPANGANYISIYLSPFFSNTAVVGVQPGAWTVRLRGIEIRDGRYHGWIERDDPRSLGRVGEVDGWQFPSFFSERSNVDNSSVNSLGCGHNIVCVANLDEAREVIAASSSQGPTRDGRFKPDVAAPGTGIVAAKGFAPRNDAWVAMSGTSMASPFVTGVAGLMLSRRPKLTASQIIGILQRSARPLPGADFRWNDASGFGAINPNAALDEVDSIDARKDRT